MLFTIYWSVVGTYLSESKSLVSYLPVILQLPARKQFLITSALHFMSTALEHGCYGFGGIQDCQQQ